MADQSFVSKKRSRALIGAGVAAAAGTAAFLLSKRTGSGVPSEGMSDAPDHVWRRGTSHYDRHVVGNTVTIGRSRQDLYDELRDFTHFPRFMENVKSVQKIDAKRSRWAIQAPGGRSVELVTKIFQEEPGESIAWESEPDSEIQTQGRVEFLDAGPGRGTMVRLTMRYDPPAGIVGKGIAKLLQREPKIQSRRDLRRCKSLMETGEIASNASPSGRTSEAPAEPRI
jgi:uncharacterized membrane protein